MRRRIAAGLLALSGLLAACTSGATAAPSTTAHVVHVQRWWSAQADYCAMLRQTIAAQHSILPGASADDPVVLATTKTFITALTAAAPSEVHAQWQLVGSSVIGFVRSQGKSARETPAEAKAFTDASRAIARDAKQRCQLDLSA